MTIKPTIVFVDDAGGMVRRLPYIVTFVGNLKGNLK